MLRAQIEIDVELVARERPLLASWGDQRQESHVDERELIDAPPLAECPAITDEALLDIERAHLEHLSLTALRPTHEQRERAALARRPRDFRQPASSSAYGNGVTTIV